MKRFVAALVLFVSAFSVLSSPPQQSDALVAGETAVATWNTSSGNTVSGSLDGVAITLNATTDPLSLQSCNFSDSSKFSHPAGASEDCYDFAANSVLTFTFSSPITNPELYFWYLRSDASPYAVSTSGGNGSVSVLSGMTNGSANNNTITQSSGFGTGIVKISGTVSGVTITSNDVGTGNHSSALISIGRTSPASSTTTPNTASSTTPTNSSSTTTPKSNTTATTVAKGAVIGATSTTTSTTTTTTTTIPAPETPSVAPGEGVVTINSSEITASVTRVNNTLNSSAGGISTTISVTQADGTQRPLNSDGNVVVMTGDTLRVETTGLAPSADADLWLNPGGVRLDTTSTDATGKAQSDVDVPDDIKSGRYRVTVSSMNAEKKPVMSTVGLVMEGKASRTSTFWIWLLIGFAILIGLAVPTTIRLRRRTMN